MACRFVIHHRDSIFSTELDEVLTEAFGMKVLRTLPQPPRATNPNRAFQSLIALLAGTNVSFLCTESEDLGGEAAASQLYQVHLYDWLDVHDHGRFLADENLQHISRQTSRLSPRGTKCGLMSLCAAHLRGRFGVMLR